MVSTQCQGDESVDVRSTVGTPKSVSVLCSSDLWLVLATRALLDGQCIYVYI
jgi:hypothetical protein